MDKNDFSKNAEALHRALELQNFDSATNRPSLRVSNEQYAKDATFEQRLSAEDKRLLKVMGIAL